MRKLATLALFPLCLLPSFAESPKPPEDFDPASLEIPADSKSPYDFRGKPDFAYPPYEALYKTKTVGELCDKLWDFLQAWEKDARKFEDPVATERYFRCKLAFIRLNYLCGRMQEGDRLMDKLNPMHGMAAGKDGKGHQAVVEKEKMARAEQRIRVMWSELGEKDDPYPKGAPKDIHELYEPLFRIVRQLSGAE